jgi:BirA family biotin operon repressor/biotin-[acetyl-CoA-carboxylase] ligase
MTLPASARTVPLLIELDAIASTNTELIARAAVEQLPPFTTIVTADQTGGRGRLDRVWVAPRGSSLAISVLIRTRRGAEGGGRDLTLEPSALGWLPLLAGLAMSTAVAELVTRPVGLKWPNDVLIGERKVCGILAELTAGGDVVIGSGLNTTMTAEQLPVPTATSLLLEGADRDELEDRAVSGYLRMLQELVGDFLAADGDARSSGVHRRVSEACTSLGRRVRVELPGGAALLGSAVELDASGRLLVRDDSTGRVVAVAAGDVTHLRYE